MPRPPLCCLANGSSSSNHAFHLHSFQATVMFGVAKVLQLLGQDPVYVWSGQSASVSETRYRLWVSFLLCSDLVKFHIVFLLEQWESKNFSVNIYVQSPWIFSSLFMKSSMAKNRSLLQFLKMIYMVWGPHHQIFMFGLYCLSLLISLQMYFCSLSLLFWMVLVTYWLWFLVYSGTWYSSGPS